MHLATYSLLTPIYLDIEVRDNLELLQSILCQYLADIVID